MGIEADAGKSRKMLAVGKVGGRMSGRKKKTHSSCGSYARTVLDSAAAQVSMTQDSLPQVHIW